MNPHTPDRVKGGQKTCGREETVLEASGGLSPASLSLLVSVSSRSLLTANILPLPQSPQPGLCSSEYLPLILASLLFFSLLLLANHTAYNVQVSPLLLKGSDGLRPGAELAAPNPTRNTQGAGGELYAGLPSGSSPGASKSLVFVLLPPTPSVSSHLPSTLLSSFLFFLLTLYLPQSLSGPDSH